MRCKEEICAAVRQSAGYTEVGKWKPMEQNFSPTKPVLFESENYSSSSWMVFFFFFFNGNFNIDIIVTFDGIKF